MSEETLNPGTTWFRVTDIGYKDAFKIEPVTVRRETEHYLYIDETQIWDGKEVTRQRRVMKQGGLDYGAKFYPTRVEALEALYEKEIEKETKLENELFKSQTRKLKLLCLLDEAQREVATTKDASKPL